MGRGRAKAKQQKVARELKYHTQLTDFDALQRELGVAEGHAGASRSHGGGEPSDVGDDYDDYDDWTGTDR